MLQAQHIIIINIQGLSQLAISSSGTAAGTGGVTHRLLQLAAAAVWPCGVLPHTQRVVKADAQQPATAERQQQQQHSNSPHDKSDVCCSVTRRCEGEDMLHAHVGQCNTSGTSCTASQRCTAKLLDTYMRHPVAETVTQHNVLPSQPAAPAIGAPVCPLAALGMAHTTQRLGCLAAAFAFAAAAACCCCQVAHVPHCHTAVTG